MPSRQPGVTLHQLRSTLARVQAEIELMEMNGVSVSHVLDAMAEVFKLLASVEGEVMASSNAPASSPQSDGVVVVIDDDARLGALTAERLSRRGFTAIYQRDLAACEMLPRDCTVLIDLGVLAAAGPAELDELQRRPLIAVSGQVGQDAKISAARLGAATLLNKPLSLLELVAAISQMQAART